MFFQFGMPDQIYNNNLLNFFLIMLFLHYNFFIPNLGQSKFYKSINSLIEYLRDEKLEYRK